MPTEILRKMFPVLFFIAMANILFAGSNIFAEYNPVEIPQIGFKGHLLPSQRVTATLNKSIQLDFKNAWGLGFEVEMPIVKYFHSGLVLQYTLLPAASATSATGLPLNPVVGRLSSHDIEFDLQLRPQVPFKVPFGYISLYGLGLFGLTIMALDPFTWGNIERQSLDEKIKLGGNILSPVGAGFNASALGGISYYPVPEFGIFAEGGYRYTYVSHRVEVLGSTKPLLSSLSYNIVGPVVAFGIKLAT